MTNKRSGASVSIGNLAVVVLGLGIAGCSLERSGFTDRALSKRTFVRAHASSKVISAKVRKPARPVNPLMGVAIHSNSMVFPVVHIPKRKDFMRYAVAYGKSHAAVKDDSVIPFALGTKKRTLERFEFASLFKRKAKPKPEPKATGTVTKSRPETKKKVPGVVAARPIRVRTTAYTHNEADHKKYGRRNALGTRLRYGKVRSAAADWSRYPVGTQFRIVGQPGILYEVDDYGGALVGTGTIDLYKPTFSAMNRWGVRHIDIEVVKWGSFAKSLKVLKPRTKWRHVRRMVQSIYKKGRDEQGRVVTLPMAIGSSRS